MFLKSKNKSDCCGCGACSDVCPKDAISMVEDETGFTYPVINEDLCINCGVCENNCIFTEKIADSSYDCKYYAVSSKDEEVVRNSSSGGFFTLMAQEILSRDGVVYGVAYDEAFRVVHQKAQTMEQAKAFRTSKYVQSDNLILYNSVHQDLEMGKTVLVTGTPCQIAGIKKALSHRRIDCSNLYTCDNICHGVSSPMTFRDYMESLKKYVSDDDRITSINMRAKKKPNSNTVLQICTQKQGAIREVCDYSYYRFFLNRIALRPSCFNCRFTSYSRSGDLSVADFWNGSDSSFSFDTRWGVNEVLINSPKGRQLFDAVCKNANFQEVTKEKAWQPHLEYPTQKPKNYDLFWQTYCTSQDKEAVIRDYLKVSPVFKVINLFTPVLRKLGLYTAFGKLYRRVFVKKK